jgi:hypothetical protein
MGMDVVAILGCHSRGRSRSHDDIDLRSHQIFGQPRQLVESADPEFNDHVLALDVSQLAQTFPELVDPEFRRLASPEKSDLVDLPRLGGLRGGGGGQGNETCGSEQEQQHEHERPPTIAPPRSHERAPWCAERSR